MSDYYDREIISLYSAQSCTGEFGKINYASHSPVNNKIEET